MVFIGNCHALTIAPIVDECGGDKHKYLKDLKYHLSKTVPEYNDTFKLLLWCKEKKLMTVYNMIFDFSLFKLKEEMNIPADVKDANINILSHHVNILIHNIGLLIINNGVLAQLMANEIVNCQSFDADSLRQFGRMHRYYTNLFLELLHFVRPRECLKKISKHMIVDLEVKNNRLNIHQHSSNLNIEMVESILHGIAKWIKALTALAEKASEES
ncbi:hypothetical protein TrispH2_004983 [Trichoplax sp. H2]|nr:hypothetical protein TrispH2_004983 [Trichoplax sp. H2]|eukprot:RDD43536.1 hypothetical protein TrispH2_004983 [Trichoplax sp. H2]